MLESTVDLHTSETCFGCKGLVGGQGGSSLAWSRDPEELKGEVVLGVERRKLVGGKVRKAW